MRVGLLGVWRCCRPPTAMVSWPSVAMAYFMPDGDFSPEIDGVRSIGDENGTVAGCRPVQAGASPDKGTYGYIPQRTVRAQRGPPLSCSFHFIMFALRPYFSMSLETL